ncbi:MAG TPA: M14 family metallopeptidase [Anaerolineales bacterium]|nr:M14 family metallopeptidase [Anaerolineales bacterium]
MNLDRYFTNQEISDVIEVWQEKFPKLLEVRTIGDSFEKRPIWLLVITNKDSGSDTDKPAVWIDANIHATEISGTTVALQVAATLLEDYDQKPEIQALLDSSVYYIVPRFNPDGAELAMADRPRYIRSGVRTYPWPERDEGLHEQDIDGDGRILQMRLPDPNGDWKISSLDPRMMEKRGPAEHGGEYYRLLPEGLLENYDGYLIKFARPPEGLDFNRNFPYEWRTEGEQRGAGPYPASEIEVKAIVDFIAQHPNINLAITYHTFSRVILRSYSNKADDAMETEDLWVTKKIGKIGTEITGYRCVSTFHDFKYHPKEVTTGAFDDWMYDHLGAYAYTIELWDLPDESGIKERKFIEWFQDHPHEDDLKILQWIDEHGEADSYIPWYKFDHPQLGKVELGGWNEMYTWRNPPPAFIGAEAKRNLPFAIAMGNMLPRLSIHTLDVKPLGNQEFHIQLVVENSGFLPSYTSLQGKKRKAVRPVRAEIEIPDTTKLISGKLRVELGHLEGRGNKLDATALWGASPTDHRARTEWVIHAEPGTEVGLQILSERAGSIRRKLKLE